MSPSHTNAIVLPSLSIIGAMMYLEAGNINTGEMRDVDFSYAIVPNDLTPYFHLLDQQGRIVDAIPREIQVLDFNIEPEDSKKYGFSGQTMFNNDNWFLFSESRLVLDLKYVGKEGDLYKFKLPHKHPGHECFRGTSGAPIIDNEGNTIALVCEGDIDEDLIFGISIRQYKSALDIEVGNVRK
ncbi:MAG TPA: hypothetical protein ENH82_04050 [bacterium]|nr:hypothetical protein [bacterium]